MKAMTDDGRELEIITRAEAKAKGLKRYFTGKPCKHGHICERRVCNHGCISCGTVKCQAYYKKNKERILEQTNNYFHNNKEKYKEHFKRYRKENKEKVREAGKKYYEENKEKIKARISAWYITNKEHVDDVSRRYRRNNKERMRGYDRKKRKNNPLSIFTRRSLRRIETATGKDRINRAEIELGYTQSEFMNHIESQFKDGMSWENRSEWHIDHIKPLSVFISEGITDPAIINALSNLQPLWATENLSKGAKWGETNGETE